MATFKSSLPDNLLKQLSERAESLSVPKNKLIKTAVRLYLEHLEKAEYIKSYKRAAQYNDVVLIAEEGMADYLDQLKE